jgi:hypothetical protein
MLKNKSSLKAVLFGLAILATIILFHKVAYAQGKRDLVLSLISKEPIAEPKEKWSKVEEITSQNGKFKGIIVYGPGTEILPTEKFTLLDSKGNMIWEETNCGPTSFIIANDGSVIGVMRVGGWHSPVVFSFFDPKGNLIKRTSNYELGNTMPQYHFLPDVNYLLFNSLQDGLLVLDLKGEIKKNLGPCRWWFTASSEFKNVLVAYEKKLRFYRNGKLVGKQGIDFPHPSAAVISSDGEYLAYSERRKLRLFEIAKAKILWKVSAPEDFIFTSVDLSYGAEKVAAIANFSARKPGRDTYGYIYVFNKKGKKLIEQKIEYSTPTMGIGIPAIDISEDGQFISVKTNDTFYKFELK